MKVNLTYERYHSNRQLQKRIINKDNFTYKNLIKFVDKYVKEPSVILDVGCGTGTIDFYLADKGSTIMGLDISRNAIQNAIQNAKKFNLDQKIDFRNLELFAIKGKNKFDFIICSEVLEHLQDDKISVYKMKSLLRTNGILIASSPSKNAPLYKMGFLKKFDTEVGHLRRYTEIEFKNLFKSCGFKVLETKKTEGILRNFLFTNSFGGFLLRILNKDPFSKIITFFDNLTIPFLGESDLYIVVQKK